MDDPGSDSSSRFKPASKYTELRAAWVSTKLNKVREQDESTRPEECLKWVVDPQKEWKMIDRYQRQLADRDPVAGRNWPQYEIRANLNKFREAKTRLEEARRRMEVPVQALESTPPRS